MCSFKAPKSWFLSFISVPVSLLSLSGKELHVSLKPCSSAVSAKLPHHPVSSGQPSAKETPSAGK